MPKVTVIIPTYNWSSVLPYSIGSVLRQTFTDFELLVVGDGCTDDSEAVVGAIPDPRVRWINLPTNAGNQCYANNEGWRQAKGRMIAYVNHDDLWLPHHLGLAVAAIDAGADLTYALTEMIEPQNPQPTFEPSEMEHYQLDQWISPTSVVHRREAGEKAGPWRHFLEVNVDPEADLWGRMHRVGCRFQFIRRLTAVKFPAVWRRDVYKLRPCHEQAAWTRRIQSEPDFEAVELARMLTPLFPDARAARPFREVLTEFGQDVVARIRRRLIGFGLLRPQSRRAFYMARRRFKGLQNKV